MSIVYDGVATLNIVGNGVRRNDFGDFLRRRIFFELIRSGENRLQLDDRSEMRLLFEGVVLGKRRMPFQQSRCTRRALRKDQRGDRRRLDERLKSKFDVEKKKNPRERFYRSGNQTVDQVSHR